MSDLPTVSVIVPCRNEEKFIGECLESIIANDYPKARIEVLVVDGMSEDGTRDIVGLLSQRYPWISLLGNPKKIMPAAVNLGVLSAKGKVIMIMSAHARIHHGYISRCVECLDQYGADNVGGVMKTVPQQEGLVGQSIVASLSHRFGVGNSYFRVNSGRARWVDTVFGGCYRREVFDKVGLFNECVPHSQDMEFNRRLRRAGGKILFVPEIVCFYYARSGWKSFLRHNLRNGVFAILPLAYSDGMPVSWRHLVPLAFMTGLMGSAVLALLAKGFVWLFLAIAAAYVLANLAVSFQIAWRERDFRYLATVPFIFATLHIGYGVGSLWGALQLARAPQFWKKLFGLARWRSRVTSVSSVQSRHNSSSLPA